MCDLSRMVLSFSTSVFFISNLKYFLIFLFLVTGIVGGIGIYFYNNGKKIVSVLLIVFTSIFSYLHHWYGQPQKFLFLATCIIIGLTLLFYGFEKLAEIINLSCRYQKEKIRIDATLESIPSEIENIHHKRILAIYEDLKAWIFMDGIEYRNITSVKTKVLLRSCHYWILIATTILVIITLFGLTIELEKLLILIPIFFVMYQYLANQHWNQWKYCADLFNNLPDPSSKMFRNKKLCLMMDLVVLDLWANKSFMEFFRYNLLTLTQDRKLSEKVVLKLLEEAQTKELANLSEVRSIDSTMFQGGPY